MMSDDMNLSEQDQLIGRASRALSALPAASPLATARIVAAVRARRAHAPSRLALALEWLREPSLSVASAGLLTAAALVVGFVTRGAFRADEPATRIANDASVAEAQPQAELAANRRGAVRTVQVPILFEARNAVSVAVLGDFNKWDAAASPMTRVGPDGPWTLTLTATPGRHLYAFLIDGTTLVSDPRAPRARDLDYGGDASVLMVPGP